MEDTLERIYAGFLGMNVGIRLGAPVEPAAWDYAMINRFYGEIRGYVKEYRNFAADDDVNGPVYFLRALLDNGIHEQLTPQAVGEAWLNYAREGIGLYWWGGEGISTEHTAYCNLKRGIPAPQSGSAAQNGIALAEQIGGQIFVDTWGLIHPGDPHGAAQMAVTAASVSHDGEGLHGAAFLAACIASAFTAPSVDCILDAGLSEIPQESGYAAVVQDIRAFHKTHPDNWRDAMAYLLANWGYDRFPGACPILPNAGVCVLSMLYGNGDFARTVEIAAMCGWDTDCNAGSVGTILGVFGGLAGIPDPYRRPLRDAIVLSGVSGYLNNLDAPTYAKFLYQLSRERRNLPSDPQAALPRGGELLYDFQLPGSTHGLRLSNSLRYLLHPGQKGLEILIDRILPADSCDVYFKPFYRREDFEDERYKPVFSPTVYSGQLFQCSMTPRFFLHGRIFLRPYLRTAVRKTRIEGPALLLEDNMPIHLEFPIPDTGGDWIAELGFHIEAAPETTSRIFALLELSAMTVTGKSCYWISTALCREEFAQQIPFSQNRGQWRSESGNLLCQTVEPAQAFTGNYYATDVTMQSQVAGRDGSCLMARAAGTRRYLAGGFLAPGKVGLRSHEGGCFTEVLADYPWKEGRLYRLALQVKGTTARLLVDGKEILSAVMKLSPHGMVGFAQELPGTGCFRDLLVEESGPYAPLLPL